MQSGKWFFLIRKGIYRKLVQHSWKYISKCKMFLEPFKIGSLTIGLGGVELGCKKRRETKKS